MRMAENPQGKKIKAKKNPFGYSPILHLKSGGRLFSCLQEDSKETGPSIVGEGDYANGIK